MSIFKRDNRIDILRFIGLAMIIFAHVEPSGIVFQLRNFDVPLMVLVSGMSFGISYKENDSFFVYLWKRIKRLVFPVWVFLTFYFLLLMCFSPSSLDLQLETVMSSYALIEGIGYVWIIRVFILVAVCSPFIYKLNLRVKEDSSYLLICLVSILLFEIIRFLSLPYLKENYMTMLISDCTHYILPFSIVFAFGIRVPSLRNKTINIVMLSSIAAFIISGTIVYFSEGKVISTQHFKYPPSIYYLSYAMFVSMFLWKFVDKISRLLITFKINKFVNFVANNSIWVYLWHIPMIKFINLELVEKYFVTIIGASLIVFFQLVVVNKISSHVKSDTIRKNIRTVFTG